MFESPHPLYAGGHYRARTVSHVSNSSTHRGSGSWDAALGVPLNDRSPARLLVTQPLCDEPEDMQLGLDASHATIPSISRTPASPISSDGDTESQQYFPPTRRQRIVTIFSRIYGTLFPSLHHFKTKTFLGKIASIFAAPAVMALTLTLPVVVMPYEHNHISPEKSFGGSGPLIDFEEEGIERALIAEEEVQEGMHELTFNKWLMAAQSILGPLFCAGVLASMSGLTNVSKGCGTTDDFFSGGAKHHLWLMLAVGICGFVLAILVVVYADRGDYTVSRMARCSMGFLVAIIWIMAIADEVVHVLQVCFFPFSSLCYLLLLTVSSDFRLHLWTFRRYHWFNDLCRRKFSC
jgi:sodium/potassium/calcium exchanger 6